MNTLLSFKQVCKFEFSVSGSRKNYETYYRSARVRFFNKFKEFSIILVFLVLSCSILVFLVISCSILDFLVLSHSISGSLWLSLAISGYLCQSKVFFTKTSCQGMKVIVFGKCDRPRGPRPVELMNFNKIYSSLDSETNG